MVDYNEAIGLRSQLISRLGSRKRSAMLSSVAEAYMGKALVYAWQGRDLEAQTITNYAVDFSYDLVSAKAAIEGMIRRRENNKSLSTIGNNRPPAQLSSNEPANRAIPRITRPIVPDRICSTRMSAATCILAVA